MLSTPQNVADAIDKLGAADQGKPSDDTWISHINIMEQDIR